MIYRYDIEAEFLQIKRKVMHPTEGLNFYIDRINTEKAASDIANYGHLITLNRVVLPTITPDEPGAVFFLVPGAYAMNYNPFVTITLESSGASTDANGTGTILSLHPTIYLDFPDPADGSIEILTLRYIQVLKDLIDATRWQDPFPRRVKDMEILDFAMPKDNRSWREVGLSVGSESAGS